MKRLEITMERGLRRRGRLAALFGAVLGGIAVIAAAGADTVVHDVRGYSCGPDQRLQRFAAFRFDANGQVTAVAGAGDERIAAWREAGDGTALVNGGGAVVLPGLIDAHGHVRGLGEARMRVDLVGAASVEEAVARVAEYARRHPGQPWILGFGWNQEQWPEPVFPTAADLDAVVDDRPVFLRRVDGHAAWVNSRALQLAEIERADQSPDGGRIEVDGQGRPSGVLIDRAMDLVAGRIPAPGPAGKEAAIRLALGELVSLGLTSVHDAGIGPEELAVYRRLADAGELPLRVYAMLAESAREALHAPLVGLAGDFLTVRSVKVYADGALGSRGAALLEPYADDPAERGLPFKSSGELDALVAQIASRGFQVNVHAIGDLANRMVLDAFAALPDRDRARRQRHRIEHAQIVSPADLGRFAALGVIASMQPTHATSDMFMAEKRLDPPRLAGAYAWRTLIESGAVIAAGSDFPVEPANPFYGFHAAVTRQNRQDEPPGGWRLDEAMTRTEALCAFTRNAAYAAHEEGRMGALAPGYWADFVFVDADPFAVPARELWKIRVMSTWVAGRRVYEAGGSGQAGGD